MPIGNVPEFTEKMDLLYERYTNFMQLTKNKKQAVFVVGTILLLLIMCPPWWIAEDIPSGATSNWICAFLGHASLFAKPPGIDVFSTHLEPSICWPQVILEFFVLAVSVLVSNDYRIQSINNRQKVVLAFCLIATLVLSFCPPWWAFEGQRFVFKKYQDFAFLGHIPQTIAPKQVQLNLHLVEPEIFWPQLALELYLIFLVSIVLMRLFRTKSAGGNQTTVTVDSK